MTKVPLNDFFTVKEAKIRSVTTGVKSQSGREGRLSDGAKVRYCTAAPTESTHSMHRTRQNGREHADKGQLLFGTSRSFK